MALAQAHMVKGLIEAHGGGLEVEIVTIKTSGDRGDRDRLGAFVREIQEALLRDEIDVALHCLKDLPTQEVPGLRLSAYLEREDPRDTLISRGPDLSELPRGAVVGTGSVRRTSQLASQRPDLTFRPLMGNVDTRLRKLMSGEYDAIVLAIAGLKRLGVLEDWASSDYRELTVHPLSPEEMLPAPGQAVLVLETRSDDKDSIRAVSPLHHAPTQQCADAERHFLMAFGGGCSVPVAALAIEEGDEIELTGLVASPDGTKVVRGGHRQLLHIGGSIGTHLAESFRSQGAFELFKATTRQIGGSEH